LTLLFDLPKGVANPSVLFGLWVIGDIPSFEVAIRLFSNLLVSFVGYQIVQTLYPSLDLLGPTLHISMHFGFLVELVLGFLLMLIVGISTKSTSISPAALVAIGVRGLLLLEGGRLTGSIQIDLSCDFFRCFHESSFCNWLGTFPRFLI
jgi:glycerol uptake facilitator-like aquaporin